MRIISVVGARPQFVKLAPVSHAFGQTDHEHLIVHTGQHYDLNMSDVFFRDLNIPEPSTHLGVGSNNHGAQTGRMLEKLDAVFEAMVPDWVLVYGDTNSTIAAALSAVKLHIPVAHLEAGLRSFNRRMPEEHNRVLTDHASDLCLAPTEVAYANLTREGLETRSILTGDVMTDVCLTVAEKRTPETLIPGLTVGAYYLATLHRPDNTDDPIRLREIIAALSSLPLPVLLTAHPRLVAKAEEWGVRLATGSIRLSAPLEYPQMVAATMNAAAVITDSGGLQKEAFLLRTPCVTVRPETEWVETVELGWNVLCPSPKEIGPTLNALLPNPTDQAPYGTGDAAAAVVSAITDWQL